MRRTNLPGPTLPETATIGVECNLLDVWIAERLALRRQISAWIFVAVAACGLLACSVPMLLTGLNEAHRRATQASQKAQILEASEQAWNKRKQLWNPKIAADEMRAKSAAKASIFLGWVIDTLNLAPSKVIVNHVKASISSGELSISVECESPNDRLAQDYVDLCSKDSRQRSVKLDSSRRSNTLGAGGESFELERKIEVGP